MPAPRLTSSLLGTWVTHLLGTWVAHLLGTWAAHLLSLLLALLTQHSSFPRVVIHVGWLALENWSEPPGGLDAMHSQPTSSYRNSSCSTSMFHTVGGQLEECIENVAEFDKNCIRIRIVDCTFKISTDYQDVLSLNWVHMQWTKPDRLWVFWLRKGTSALVAVPNRCFVVL